MVRAVKYRDDDAGMQTPFQQICLLNLFEQEIHIFSLSKVPLNGSTAVCCVIHSSRFCIICELAEGAHCPIVQVLIQ